MNISLKQILAISWKTGLGLLGLVACCLAVVVTFAWIKDTYGRDSWYDKSLSETVDLHYFNDDTYRVWNRQTERYTTPRVKWVSGAPERDSLTVFCTKNGERGFLNIRNGEVIIPARYTKAWHFSEGLGAVSGKDGKIGFINHDGESVIGFEIPYQQGFDYIFKNGFCIVKAYREGRWSCAVYGKDGHLVLPWEYYDCSDPDPEGYRIFRNKEGEWLFDRNFELVFPQAYEDITFAEEQKGVFLTSGHIKILVDYEGHILEPFVIDNTLPLKYLVRYGDDGEDEYALVPEIVRYQVGYWEGLLDTRTGKPLTPPLYWSLEMISKDLILAKVDRGEEGILLDKRGHPLPINCK